MGGLDDYARVPGLVTSKFLLRGVTSATCRTNASDAERVSEVEPRLKNLMLLSLEATARLIVSSYWSSLRLRGYYLRRLGEECSVQAIVSGVRLPHLAVT